MSLVTDFELKYCLESHLFEQPENNMIQTTVAYDFQGTYEEALAYKPGR